MNQQQFSRADYGLIGYPLGHSFSKAFFTELFKADGTGRSYENFEMRKLDAASLYSLVLLAPKLKGFNVTAPYKRSIQEFLDYISPEAAAVGAVNTVKINRDATGRVTSLEGYNTDVKGFAESAAPFIADMPACCGALVLGTGGASLAVKYALESMGHTVLRVSREHKGEGIIAYEDINSELLQNYPFIVNATPAGTFPAEDTCAPFPFELLGHNNRVFDLVYNPAVTLFMKRAMAQGAQARSGEEMLHIQALEALKIWTNE
ncbi:MAG: shikimate dehydrogenase [Muribaculaceae bacterium]|nr:shikimate dehydrogenase [Muribaculaceae bacterium]